VSIDLVKMMSEFSVKKPQKSRNNRVIQINPSNTAQYRAQSRLFKK